MKIRRIIFSAWILMFIPSVLMSQTEKIDLNMIYKIKQEGQRNSAIEDLAFGLTDFTGPRLTGSTGSTRGNEWAKKKMEEFKERKEKAEAAIEAKGKIVASLEAKILPLAPLGNWGNTTWEEIQRKAEEAMKEEEEEEKEEETEPDKVPAT